MLHDAHCSFELIKCKYLDRISAFFLNEENDYYLDIIRCMITDLLVMVV